LTQNLINSGYGCTKYGMVWYGGMVGGRCLSKNCAVIINFVRNRMC